MKLNHGKHEYALLGNRDLDVKDRELLENE
mgnify:CR=1 FL=1